LTKLNPFEALNTEGAKGDDCGPENSISCSQWRVPPLVSMPAAQQQSGIPAESVEKQERPVSWKKVVPNFLNDQAHIWLFPLQVAQGKHWQSTLAALTITAGLVALDPYDTPYFRRTNNFLTFNDIFKVTTTERVFLGLPPIWYLVGLVRRDSYAQHTAFFAGEAVADVDILAGVMRSVDGRLHPRDIPPDGDYTHTWFKAKGTYVNRGGFPSGHTAGAFAVATIFARRYGPRHRWLPWVAYSLAALTGASRITDSAHFPSDVAVGGLLAYTISRYVVLREP
jgi:membrane-associated phospholipid phosphatase